MTIREINRTISTANYATYTISALGGGNIRYKELHYSEIPARFDLYSSSGLIRAGCRWPDIPKSYKGAQVATLWIKEIDFTGCIIDCEVHFK